MLRPATVLASLVLAAATAGCTNAVQNQPSARGSSPTDIAEAALDAFYSWDAESLAAMISTPQDRDRLVYYQGWAQGADYQVQTRRPCRLTPDASQAVVTCAVTVTDNFGKTLGYIATDTFTFTVREAMISTVWFEGDDPPVFAQLLESIQQNQPEILTGPCKDMFAGGTTPGACAQAVVGAAEAFAKTLPNR